MSVDTFDPQSMIEITPIIFAADNTTVLSRGLPILVKISDFTAIQPVASLTAAGPVLKAAFVANAAVPYADLTTAANHVNSILASLQAAGVMAAS